MTELNVLLERKDLTIKELEDEMRERKELKAGMVGSLYPAILESEISKIYARLRELRGERS